MNARERHARLMEIFDRVCDLPAPERPPLLDQLCLADPTLRCEVEAMLAEDAQPDSPLERPVSAESSQHPQTSSERLARALLHAVGSTTDTLARAHHKSLAQSETKDPERLGPYRVVRRLGQGGMGTVYEAEQESPRRKVALKVVHPWLLSNRVVQRFRFESDALAQLLHPGIPQVYAVGEADGRFYFAMELVTGRALLESVEGASLAQRVECLARIADAVHHAHLRGFLHRDLKPDNIRVDGRGQPKVLDFGISTVTDAEGEAAEVELSGTLAYMSPEQVSQGTVDVRSDVFALGLIAFELLGAPRARKLSGLSFAEALRVVREERVQHLAQALPDAPFELCAIIDRAIAHQPAQRYESAHDLAIDLRRFLRGEAVEAVPPSSGYRARVFFRQHRLLVAASLAVMLALLFGGAAAFVEYRRAEAARALESKQRARAEATVEFLEALLLEAHPNRSVGRDLTMREALDRAAERLDRGALRETPEVEASVRHTISDAYNALGHGEAARAQLAAVEALIEGGLLTNEEVIVTIWAAIAELEIHHGALSRADAYAQRSVAIERRLRPGGVQLGEALQVLAELWRELGRMPEAEAAYREVWALRERLHEAGELPLEEVTGAMNQLALTLTLVGQEEEAGRLYAEALRRDLGKWGPDHPEIATGLHHEAWFEYVNGRHEAAREKLKRARKIREATLGKDHPRLGAQRALEAQLALDERDLEHAEQYIDEGLAILGREVSDAPMVARYRLVKAEVLRDKGQLAEAEQVAREVMDALAARYGETTRRTAEARAVLGDILRLRGRAEEGCALYRTAVDQLVGQLGEASPSVKRARKMDGASACAR